MTNDNRDAGVSESSAPLELNKETLKDLDLIPGEAEEVKGGRSGSIVTSSGNGQSYESRTGSVVRGGTFSAGAPIAE